MQLESPAKAEEAVSHNGSSPTGKERRKPALVIRASTGWVPLHLAELWSFRDLLWILIERDIKLRYKQTALGVTWVVLQPLIAALIFTAVFGRMAKLPCDGAPYLLFVFCGLTIWTYFSQAMQRASNSLVKNAQLVSKIYFPRSLIPLSHTLAVLVDFAVMLIVLFILMAVYRTPFTLRLFVLPGLLFLAILTATGTALWFSALSVKYRDCAYALPYFVQVWMYASPVVYAASIVPLRWRTWFALNPAVGFIEGFRWAVLGHGTINATIVFLTIIMSFVAIFSGAFFFRRVERGFADII